MADNPYIDYYLTQAGGGYSIYTGVPYQEGEGVIVDFIKDKAIPYFHVAV